VFFQDLADFHRFGPDFLNFRRQLSLSVPKHIAGSAHIRIHDACHIAGTVEYADQIAPSDHIVVIVVFISVRIPDKDILRQISQSGFSRDDLCKFSGQIFIGLMAHLFMIFNFFLRSS